MARPTKTYDPKRRCAMCGSDDISTRYNDGVGRCSIGRHFTTWVDADTKDTLARRCLRCGYVWSELPV